MQNIPILWTFRRCPYAMRARIAVMCSGIKVELREIVLRDKPEAFLQTSASGTVPALKHNELIIDESLDIMTWALEQRDPLHLLDMPKEGWELIALNDGPFKAALDHTKYSSRYPDLDMETERSKASQMLMILNDHLRDQLWLFGDRPTIADYAILPFIRQFAHIDRAWFDSQPWPNLIKWLDQFMNDTLFTDIMHKYSPWQEGATPIWFGGK